MGTAVRRSLLGVPASHVTVPASHPASYEGLQQVIVQWLGSQPPQGLVAAAISPGCGGLSISSAPLSHHHQSLHFKSLSLIPMVRTQLSPPRPAPFPNSSPSHHAQVRIQAGSDSNLQRLQLFSPPSPPCHHLPHSWLRAQERYLAAVSLLGFSHTLGLRSPHMEN